MPNVVCSFEQFQSDLCLSSIDSHWLGISFEVILFLLTFAGLAFAAEHLCNSMETLCDHWNIPEDVGGATFIALGGSIPEIAINCIATFKSVHSKSSSASSVADMGVGAILGSGMIAYLLIPGLSSLFTSEGLRIHKRSIYRDATFYGLAVLTLMSALHSGLSIYHAPIMIGIYVCYVLVLVFSDNLNVWWSHAIGHPHLAPRKQESVFRERYSLQISPGSPIVEGLVASTVPLLEMDDSPLESTVELACMKEEDINDSVESSMASRTTYAITLPLRYLVDKTCPDCRIHQRRESWYLLTFITSFSWITFFSFIITVIVDRWVELINVPSASALFGLLIVAAGAEIPDGVNAITISKRGFGNMAISACLGAQVINICIGLGLPWLVLMLSKISVPVTSGTFFVHESSFILFFDVLVFLVVVLWSSSGSHQALLTGKKAILLLAWYVVSVGYIAYSTTAVGAAVRLP